jgi:ABC-type nitrate/sulfonate/bicarbonate transport system substrate-binding protein
MEKLSCLFFSILPGVSCQKTLEPQGQELRGDAPAVGQSMEERGGDPGRRHGRQAPRRSAGALVLPAVILLLGCHPAPDRVSLTVSLPALEQNALLYVAEDRGFLSREGLDVKEVACDSGVTALRRLVEGTAEVAVAAEYPVVAAVMGGADLSIVACVDVFENDYLVVAPCRGASVGGLAGKRIGLARGTVVDYYLGRLFFLDGIDAAPGAGGSSVCSWWTTTR